MSHLWAINKLLHGLLVMSQDIRIKQSLFVPCQWSLWRVLGQDTSFGCAYDKKFCKKWLVGSYFPVPDFFWRIFFLIRNTFTIFTIVKYCQLLRVLWLVNLAGRILLYGPLNFKAVFVAKIFRDLFSLLNLHNVLNRCNDLTCTTISN